MAASYSLAIELGPFDPPLQRGGRFERDPHQVVQLLPQLRLGAAGGQAGDLGLANLNLQRLHPQQDFGQLVEQRLQAVVAEVHLLDQADGLVAAAGQPRPGGPPLAHADTAC